VSDKLYIIAEAGVNHNGSLQTAFELIEAACSSGADCIKFQAFSADELVTKKAPKAEYQKQEKEESQYDMLLKLELSEEDFRKIAFRCSNRPLDFLATPFSPKWVKIFCDIGVKGFKISSGSITSLNLLKAIAKTKLPVILSTGMSEIEDIRRAVEVLRGHGCDDLSLLHCVTLYPTPIDKVNLFAMHALKKEFNVPVGFSDHTTDTMSGALAVAAGASILEKHFTLDRDMEGPDHRASLVPSELREYISQARRAYVMCGHCGKDISPEELDIKKVVQSSLVAKRFINKGETISEEILMEKRPATGISPMDLDKVIGKIVIRDIEKDEVLKYEYFKQ